MLLKIFIWKLIFLFQVKMSKKCFLSKKICVYACIFCWCMPSFLYLNFFLFLYACSFSLHAFFIFTQKNKLLQEEKYMCIHPCKAYLNCKFKIRHTPRITRERTNEGTHIDVIFHRVAQTKDELFVQEFNEWKREWMRMLKKF